MDNTKSLGGVWSPSKNIQGKYIVSATEGLSSELVAIVYSDDESEAKKRAALCAGSKDMYSTLRAIKARIKGEFDNIHLKAKGDLTNTNDDIMRFIDDVLGQIHNNL